MFRKRYFSRMDGGKSEGLCSIKDYVTSRLEEKSLMGSETWITFLFANKCRRLFKLGIETGGIAFSDVYTSFRDAVSMKKLASNIFIIKVALEAGKETEVVFNISDVLKNGPKMMDVKNPIRMGKSSHTGAVRFFTEIDNQREFVTKTVDNEDDFGLLVKESLYFWTFRHS